MPAVSVGPSVAYIFIIGGIILNMTGLLTIGILLFGLAVLFSVLTLPVEIQASQKALAMLESTGVVTTQQDRDGAQVDAACRRPDLPCRRGRGHPDAPLLRDPRTPEQLTRQRIPEEVLTAAHERAKARAARDWATADRLRGEIESAGWTIVDRGTDFALSPASPPDVEEGGGVRYGASRNVPSRLDEPPSRVWRRSC